VFVGTVGDLVAGLDYTRTIYVGGVYKGDVPAVVSVNTGQEGPNGAGNSCNYDLAAGKELLFYADGAGAAYTAGACNHPTEAGRGVLQHAQNVTGEAFVTYAPGPAEDAQGEVPETEPDTQESGPGRWVWPAIGLVALVVAVVAVLRRRTVGREV
jgi:hypothetical protein